jgi:transposase
MLPSNRVRIVVATKPVDWRKGHDGLAARVKNELRKGPFTGTVFVFRSKRADRLTLRYWDGTAYVMASKRLEEHTFTWPAIKDGLMALNHAQFEALFSGLDWRKVRALSVRPPTASPHCGGVGGCLLQGAGALEMAVIPHVKTCRSPQ